MFFLIPVGSEEGVRRWPYFTIGLIVLNALIWIATSIALSSQVAEVARIDEELRTIEMRYLSRMLEVDPSIVRPENYERMRQRIREGEIILPDDPSFEKWLTLYEALQVKLANTVFEKYGFKPNRFNPWKVFSSMFIHANFFHLLFNMLFLWLVGCNIEDDWSWKIFGGLYVISGFAACGLHALVFPASSEPLVGASGAIAGVMGAFMIRHWKTKIWFAYFFWIFFRPFFGRFAVYAGIALPIWLLEQIVSARWSVQSGVAYYAHIGGFIFGAVLGAFFKVFGIEKKYIAPMVEDSFEKLSLSQPMKDGYKKLEAGDTAAAVAVFEQVQCAEPDNADCRLILARHYLEGGDPSRAAVLYDQALAIALKNGDFQLTLSIYEELKEKNLIDATGEKNGYNLGTTLEGRARYADALAVYETVLKKFPQSRVRAKILNRVFQIYKNKTGDPEKARQTREILKAEFPDWVAE